MTDAQETQLLMEAISAQERELEERSRPHPWWPNRPRLDRFSQVAAVIGWIGVVAALLFVALARTGAEPPSPPTPRDIAVSAQAIPWRHFKGTQLAGGPCHVWMSDLGLAEAMCGGHVEYHGVGRVDETGFHAQPRLPHQTRHDDATRDGEVDLQQRRAIFGGFDHCHRSAPSCGWLEIDDLVEVHP